MKILYASDVLLMICQMQVQYEWKLYVYPKFKTVFSSCNGLVKCKSNFKSKTNELFDYN